tara:strand:- start:448 stop:1275 length:828 start_codon:yes stop_codon:yes gene_type:complete
MSKLFTVLVALLTTVGVSAQTDAGTFHMAFGTAYSPLGSLTTEFLPFFRNSSGMSFGNEWTTGITVDGDDNNDFWDNDQKESLGNFNVSCQFGFFVRDGLLTGVGIEYARVTANQVRENFDFDGDGVYDKYTVTSLLSSLALSPFVKYYIPVGPNALFIKTSYTFGSMNSRTESEWNNTGSANEDSDYQAEPWKTSRLDFGAGMAFFLNDRIALEPTVNFAVNRYTQEQEVFMGYDPTDWENIYENQEVAVSTSSLYLKIVASIYFPNKKQMQTE